MDNSTQFPKHSNILKCVPVLVHQIIVISKDARLICKMYCIRLIQFIFVSRKEENPEKNN